MQPSILQSLVISLQLLLCSLPELGQHLAFVCEVSKEFKLVDGMEMELKEGSLLSCWECHVNGGSEMMRKLIMY